MAAPPRWAPDWRSLLALLAVAPWVALVPRWWFVCDDAYITFRYALHVARGRGFVWNVGEEHPVEGFSNLGWLLVAAGVRRAGGEMPEVMPWISVACAAATLFGVWWILRHRFDADRTSAAGAVLVLGAMPSFAVWSTSGLETMAVALCALAATDGLLLGGPAVVGALGAAGLVLVRVDGWVWVGALAVWSLLSQDPRRTAKALIAPALVLAGVAAWRLATFGTVVPHIAHVKVGLDAAGLARGLEYVGSAWLQDHTPLLLFAGAPIAIGTPKGRALVMIALLPTWLSILATGDFLPFWRMLLPGFPLGAVLFGLALGRIPLPAARLGVAGVVAGLGLCAAAGNALAPLRWRQALQFRDESVMFRDETERWEQVVRNTDEFTTRARLLKELANPGDGVVSVAVGCLGYYADRLVILDRGGLVDAEVGLREVPRDEARRRSPGHDKVVPAEFFLDRDPRFLHTRSVSDLDAPTTMGGMVAEWDVAPEARARYVPDFVGEGRYLLMVRRVEPHEDAEALWASFEERLDTLDRFVHPERHGP